MHMENSFAKFSLVFCLHLLPTKLEGVFFFNRKEFIPQAISPDSDVSGPIMKSETLTF